MALIRHKITDTIRLSGVFPVDAPKFLLNYPLSYAETKIMRAHSIGMSTFDVPDFVWRGVFD